VEIRFVSRIDRYILREALPIFIFGLVLYIGLGLISNFLPRAQWFSQSDPVAVLKWLGLQIPAALVQAMPVAALLAVLIAMGRLSRENELLAFQAGGVSLLRAARVFLVGGAVLTLVSLALSQWVIPLANRATVLVYWNEVVGTRVALGRLAGQDLPIGEYRLRFVAYDASQDRLQQVRLERWQDRQMSVILAQTAQLKGDQVVFWDYQVYTLDFSGLPLADFATLEQAQTRLQQVFKSQNIGPPGASLTVRVSRNREDLEASFSGGGFESPQRLSDWWSRWQNPQTAPKERLEARAQFHLGLALSLANLMVLVLALPVAARRATSPGAALSVALVLTIAYYIVYSSGKVAALSGALPPEIAAWAANLLAIAVGWAIGKGVYR
jgi:lipopolysaccharide export system permease protein